MTQVTFGGRFDGKVAIVTGSGNDPSIGRSTAMRLGLEGARVVINARSEERLAATERELTARGVSVRAVPGSVEDDALPARLVDAAFETFGGVDLVVNTVGGSRYIGAPLEMTREQLLDTVSLNTWPALALIQEAVGRGLGDGGGAVVNISSGTTMKTTPSMIAYKMAKTALNAMTTTLARELGPRGIRVNGVAPGLTLTSATEGIFSGDGGAAFAASQVLPGVTGADDIAATVTFLLSPDAAQVTGQVIDVDGGNNVMGVGFSPFAPKGA